MARPLKTRLTLDTQDIATILDLPLPSVRRMISCGSMSLTGNAEQDFFTIMTYKIGRIKRALKQTKN